VTRQPQDGVGWRAFAGTLIFLAGVLNFVDGIVTLEDPHYFVAIGYGNRLIFGDTRSWGWAILIVGIVQFLTGLAIFFERNWAALLGIVIAALSATAQLLYIGTDPWWSIIVIALDVLVIYALALHGFKGGRHRPDALHD